MSEINLQLVDGHAVTTSNQIAQIFRKNHAHVLEKIEALECSDDFRQSNFRLAEYKDRQSKPRKAYQITRDGFTLLAMSFTGKRAMQFKEAYIEAFNRMEQQLQGQGDQQPALPAPEPQDHYVTQITTFKNGEIIGTQTYPGVVAMFPADEVIKLDQQIRETQSELSRQLRQFTDTGITAYSNAKKKPSLKQEAQA